MIDPEKVKEMDNYDLCEEVRQKLEILGLCIDGVLEHYQCSPGIRYAFDEADTLICEMNERLFESNN
ncbi:hypothetical protein [Fodinibius halophilus]|uniref:Uncharacterized protein n=1 Tax=Fodinibius halophilus TaxID=1736908 RepID=A0A6M1T1S6_9BACT|nr:hypothetical protein [Fodinibius halophilus]NGP90018.1 hypothetical protein [Fodinibius halophilus]